MFLSSFGQLTLYITVYIYIDLCIEPSLHLWKKPDLTMVNDLCDVFLNSFCIIRSCLTFLQRVE